MHEPPFWHGLGTHATRLEVFVDVVDVAMGGGVVEVMVVDVVVEGFEIVDDIV